MPDKAVTADEWTVRSGFNQAADDDDMEGSKMRGALLGISLLVLLLRNRSVRCVIDKSGPVVPGREEVMR